MHSRIVSAIKEDLVHKLQQKIESFDPVATGLPQNYQVGDIEDANVLVKTAYGKMSRWVGWVITGR